MNNMKKLASLLLALVMVLAMAVPAMADGETYKITINSDMAGHEYTAYQIFAGDLSTDTNNKLVLSNIVWGNDITDAGKAALLNFGGTAYASPAALAEALTTGNAADFAAEAAKYVTGGTASQAITDGYEITGLDAGYYLVATTKLPETGGAYTKFMLEVVGDATATPKTDAPTVEKKVQENVKEVTGDEPYGEQYNDVADYNIGDAVPFAFYSEVPEISHFNTYKMVFHDNMSAGLTFNADSVEVKIGNTTLTKGTDYTVVTEGLTDGCEFHVVINNLKNIEAAVKGADIRIDFTATLNTNAVIGLDGNPNEVKLEYSNNPNWKPEFSDDDIDNDGDGEVDEDDEDEKDEPTGETPWDQVIVFTYELDVTKVDSDNEETKLQGAQFVLMNAAKTHVAKIEDGKFAGWVDDATITKNNGVYPAEYTLTSDANGFFKVVGLDDGTYYLKETVAPTGYNLLTAPIEVVITAKTINDQDWTSPETAKDALTELEISVDNGDAVDGNTDTGVVNMTVKNDAGAQLPETGGMGTTMIYVIGGLLVAGAAIMLFAKKRAAK